MAQTLLAILFATSSAKDNMIAFRWPASPHASPRLARPRPPSHLDYEHADAPYRTATFSEFPHSGQEPLSYAHLVGDKFEYEWQRPTIKRYRSQSFASSGRSSSGGRHSPVTQRNDRPACSNGDIRDYDTIFGYNVGLLAHFLCPTSDNCHQKFELIVDDLAFIGHPVCMDQRGTWSFKEEPPGGNASREQSADGRTTEDPASNGTSENMLQLFHIVFVLDLPDPSSSASGNLNKYFDTIYQTVAFSLTAVLFNEQVLHNYVEHEWDVLVKQKEDCISNGETYEEYNALCLEKSSLARILEQVYTSIRSNSLARMTINNISLDLQLPPLLDALLRVDPSDPYSSPVCPTLGSVYGNEEEEEERPGSHYASWGPELSFGWKLPSLTPWKSLLLLDIDPKSAQNRADPPRNRIMPGTTKEEDPLATSVSRFLAIASVFISLSEMATILEWDLHKQVYPAVRYLVQRRRAKVVDLVRSSLKSIFTLPPHFEPSMPGLSIQFARDFPTLPALPVIFSRLSASPDNFFETVVRSKEHIPIYKNVIIWLLKRDLLVMMHMRFRLIATPTLKKLVALHRQASREAREHRRVYQNERGRRRKSSAEYYDMSVSQNRSIVRSASVLLEDDEQAVEDDSEDEPLVPLSTNSSTYRNRDASSQLTRDDLDHDSVSESDPDDSSDLEVSSLISNPERATPKESRWLKGMTFGKNPAVAKRFENIHKFFDGKMTVDEILYKAEISRKELREVLHHFTDHVSSCLKALTVESNDSRG
ncbi:nitrogen permease regulator of amino acid transport activity 3-domain-containing protein [Hysterangium stoloniferum]|nr:nitrogen permease regulator of amino acid transport activity 3-domain-containing protein [Hysterangium stoloniferum]